MLERSARDQLFRHPTIMDIHAVTGTLAVSLAAMSFSEDCHYSKSPLLMIFSVLGAGYSAVAWSYGAYLNNLDRKRITEPVARNYLSDVSPDELFNWDADSGTASQDDPNNQTNLPTLDEHSKLIIQ